MAKKVFAKKKTIPFHFGPKHIAYIRSCVDNTYNIAEGAVRAGKTIDNIYAFAHELETHPDKLHLATGSTASNAKLNIGDANGFGLEYIFRGQCKWGKYKGNDCLMIQGPKTGYKPKVVIFAGAALANSYKKIRGNSYGMWIATEINLHHDNTIKEAFNRTLASQRRKFFWDLNPDHPKAPIYFDYIDKYRAKAASGELLGGVNYEHFTIFDNTNISEQARAEFISQYEEGTVWYMRDIQGIRCIAEGLIYKKIAKEFNAKEKGQKPHLLTIEQAKAKSYISINVAVDFGGTASGHSFTATGITEGYEELVALMSERHVEDPRREEGEIDPDKLGELFVAFVRRVLRTFGYVTIIYCDSEASVLIRGLKKALAAKEMGHIPVKNALKTEINDRIFAFTTLSAQGRFFYTELCDTLMEALSTAIWDPKEIKLVRLDDGTSDIDSLDSFEYTYERDIKRLTPSTG